MRLLPSVCKTFHILEYMDLEDLQQIAATVQVKTSCLVVCILRCWMAPDHEVSGAVAAICLQDLSHPLNIWILRICNRLRQPCR